MPEEKASILQSLARWRWLPEAYSDWLEESGYLSALEKIVLKDAIAAEEEKAAKTQEGETENGQERSIELQEHENGAREETEYEEEAQKQQEKSGKFAAEEKWLFGVTLFLLILILVIIAVFLFKTR